jgi:molybdopterin synthase sulfur carrier subunit
MARGTLELPSLLRSVLGERGEVPVEGETLADAIEDGCRKVPGLRVHLRDESGKFRPHVLCFHNDVNTRWLDTLDVPLSDGDRITILQAVSGGSVMGD